MYNNFLSTNDYHTESALVIERRVREREEQLNLKRLMSEPDVVTMDAPRHTPLKSLVANLVAGLKPVRRQLAPVPVHRK